MTTELEQEFFKAFGIEPKKQGYCDWQSDCPYSDIKCGDDCPCWKYENELKYPEITDRKLLKMICILNETACEVLAAENIEDLKNEILETCIKVYNTPILTSDGDEYDNDAIYDKIQQLFKEGE